jgi:diguanylate cyclase (GGDEF)-like protein
LGAFLLIGGLAADQDRMTTRLAERQLLVFLTLLLLAGLIAPTALLAGPPGPDSGSGPGRVIGIVAGLLVLLVTGRTLLLVHRLQEQAARLAELALVDPLTGLANRRAISTRLSTETELARRQPHRLAVTLLDLDHFARYNDEHGRRAGSQLLVETVAGWLGRLRASDVLARIDGDRFLVLLPGSNAEQVERSVIRLAEVIPAGQTVSAGIALWDGQETSDELIERATVALTEAKTAGRNCSRVALATKPAWPLPGSGVRLSHVEPLDRVMGKIPAARRSSDGLVAPPVAASSVLDKPLSIFRNFRPR